MSSVPGPDLQSMSSAWPSLPITEMNWSMIPQGIPANVCSAFWHASALATKSPSSVPQQSYQVSSSYSFVPCLAAGEANMEVKGCFRAEWGFADGLHHCTASMPVWAPRSSWM